MNIIETDAIVLSTKDYGESDRLVTLHTDARGRLRGIAKGARRSRKRFAHAFESCSLVRLSYREKSSLIWIEGCKLLEPHMALRTEVERWGYAAMVSEIILEMAPEGEPQPELFSLLKSTLSQLSEDKDPLNVVLLFAFRFQDIMGYLPALEGCRVCGRPLKTASKWWWAMDRGVLNCADHRPGDKSCLEIDLGTLLLIHQLRKVSQDKIWRLRFLQNKQIPLFHALTGWVRSHLRRDLKSLKLLEQIRRA